MILLAPAGTKPQPSVIRDDSKNTSAAVIVLPLAVPDQTAREPLIVQLVIAGSAA
jgi:hypothetical protein